MASGTPTNITIDDEYGDALTGAKVIYSGFGSSNCQTCMLQPDVTALYNGTWHYARTDDSNTAPLSFTLNFTGTAVYVYGVAFSEIDTYPSVFAVTNLTFTLNGQPSFPSYFANPLPGPNNPTAHFEYNTLVYAKNDLSNGAHTLQVSLALHQNERSAFLFDYAKYTSETKPSGVSGTTATPSSSGSQHHSISTGAIAGIVIGAMIWLLFMSIAALCFMQRKRRRHRLLPGTDVDLTPAAQSDVFMQGTTIPAAITAYLPRKKRAEYHTMDGSAGLRLNPQQGEISSLRAEVGRLQAQNTALATLNIGSLPPYNVVAR